jgi:energy-coupling factor transport system permease protein
MTSGLATATRFSPLGRRNPVAKLAASLAVGVAAFLAADPLTPLLLLAGVLLVVPICGLPIRILLLRCWALLAGALGITLANLLYSGIRTGTVLLDTGPIYLTTGGLLASVALGLRVSALALPGILALATTDPTDLADSLVQQLRLPARFAYGALAALRMLPLLTTEWRTIGLARRARGVEAGRNPVAALRLFGGQVFTLLVGAVRRAVRLAAAMDSRGFDTAGPRTFARQQSIGRADAGLIAAAVLLALSATGVSVATGHWQFLGSI